MLLKYKTFAGPGQDEIVEKKSRFIANAGVVSSEAAAQDFIGAVRKKYNGAGHHVFAYRIEGGAMTTTILERQSDDGEPSGTAGMPILDVLRGEEILNGIIVVSRYFGGTLLGTGGLVRAYGRAAKEGLKAAGVIEKKLYQEIRVKTDYTLSGKIQHELAQQERHVQDILYTDSVEFIVFVEKPEEERFLKSMTDLSAGTAELIIGPAVYGAFYQGAFRLIDEIVQGLDN